MTTRVRVFVISLFALSLGTVRAHAQTDHAHLGVQGIYNTTFGDGGIGVQLSVPMARHLEFYPSFDYYFQNPGTHYEGNIDFKYRAIGQNFDWIYIGSGFNLAHETEDGVTQTQGGWNLLAGAESLRGQIHPFIESRITVSDQTRFQIEGGVNITLGHEK